MCTQMDLVDDSLKWFFRRLGRQIGMTPLYFIIVPVLLTALAATGFQRITHEADPEYLFSPLDGAGKTERNIMESLFPMNYSDYDPGRVSRGGRFGRLLITALDNTTILKKNVFDEIILLNSLVENVTVEWKGVCTHVWSLGNKRLQKVLPTYYSWKSESSTQPKIIFFKQLDNFIEYDRKSLRSKK